MSFLHALSPLFLLMQFEHYVKLILQDNTTQPESHLGRAEGRRVLSCDRQVSFQPPFTPQSRVSGCITAK